MQFVCNIEKSATYGFLFYYRFILSRKGTYYTYQTKKNAYVFK